MSKLIGDPTTDTTLHGDGITVTRRMFHHPEGAWGASIPLYSARPDTEWSWHRNVQVAWRDADLIRDGVHRTPWGVARG